MRKYFKKRPYIFFILPAFLAYTVFTIYPMVSVLPYSLTEWSGIGAAKFVGLQNFITIFNTPNLFSQMKNAFKNTFIYLLLVYIIQNPIVIAVAYLCFKKMIGSSVYKVVIFMPQFINAVAVAFIITLFFAPGIGLYGSFMNLIGLGQWANPGIWMNPSMGILLLLLVGAWRGVGYEMLLYIAAFSTVPVELDEAAKIDGAGELYRFFHIYLPLISPTFTNVFVLLYIWTLTIFDIPYLIGGLGGGVGGTMDTVQLFFYRTIFGSSSYSSNFMGLGSALSVVILAVLILGSLFLQRMLSKRVFYMN